MDTDENLTQLLSMGFPDIDECQRALRMAKNDLSEAVAILAGDTTTSSSSSLLGPLPDSMGSGRDKDVDMIKKDERDENGFPLTNLYELETRVFQDNWSIPYKREESLGKCLVAAAKLAEDGLMESHESCAKFIDRILPEAFQKLLKSNATQRWQGEIQEGIYDMLDLFIDVVVTRLKNNNPDTDFPLGIMAILGTAFDIKNDWNHKNRDKGSRAWHKTSPNPRTGASGSTSGRDYALPLRDTLRREQYEWLCDLVNIFGEKEGFDIFANFFKQPDLTARPMAALLAPLGGCAELLVFEAVSEQLTTCMDGAFKFVENVDESALRGKEIAAISDLLTSLKLLCLQFRPDSVEECDRLRLNIISRMLKTPTFSSKMNALKEVSRLIEESGEQRSGSGKHKHNVSVDQVVEWMAENKILTTALEGNIDQVQYTDRIKAIVEFLGPRLSEDELSKMWRLGDMANNAHVVDNIYAIMSSAAAKFSLAQFEHLTTLVKESWEKSSDRVREKLLVLIGQIGKDATQNKSTQAILQLLWDISRVKALPKTLVEKALSEHLSILTDMTINKNQVRKNYILKCIDDIKDPNNSVNVVPSVNHLHNICKTYSKSGTYYNKTDKATLGELNKEHEIVKALSVSLRRCHERSSRFVAKSQSSPLAKKEVKAALAIDERYSHQEVIDSHLDLMKFLLKEGDLYLSWARCRELWETLVVNPRASIDDNNKLFVWFEACITDLETGTQESLFNMRLLEYETKKISEKSFSCVKIYFEAVNKTSGKLKKSHSPPMNVEDLDLVGIEYIWRIISNCDSESIANEAIDYLLKLNYFYVNSNLKTNLAQLHTDFIGKCYKQLEDILEEARSNTDSGKKVVSNKNKMEAAVASGSELEASMSSTSEALTTISISNIAVLPTEMKEHTLRRVRRIFQVMERYVSAVEEAFPGERNILPHGASFFGQRVNIKVVHEAKNEEFDFQSHTNESLGSILKRMSQELKISNPEDLHLNYGDVEISMTKAKALLGPAVGFGDEQLWLVKPGSGTSTNTSLMLYNDKSDLFDAMASSSHASGSQGGSSKHLDDMEKELPSVVMASGNIFRMLNHLSDINDSKILAGIRRLIHMIPTDPYILDVFDSVSYFASLNEAKLKNEASPKMSPRIKKLTSKAPPAAGISTEKEAMRSLARILGASADEMNPFRLLYNLEVLAGRLMPTTSHKSNWSAQQFCNDFIHSDGIRLILNVLEKGSMPTDVDYDIRQSAYLVALQIIDHLLCGDDNGNGGVTNPVTRPHAPLPAINSSPVMKPTPPKRSALDASAATSSPSLTDISSNLKSPSVLSATRVVQTMSDEQFWKTISCLMRVVWAAAAGNLRLANSAISNGQKENPRFHLGRRSRDNSRDNSTGSSGSESFTNLGNSPPQGGGDGQSSGSAGALYPGVCSQQTRVHEGDCQIAAKALELMVTCLNLRNSSIHKFFSLPWMKEFLIDILLNSPSEFIRKRACEQFIRLSKIKVTSRCLKFDEDELISGRVNAGSQTPRQLMTKLLLKIPLPLWMPSSKSRGISPTIIAQCTEYFDLRCALLKGLSKIEQKVMLENTPVSMIEDELTFLQNFAVSNRFEDCTLLAGHLKLVATLLTCEGVDKEDLGAMLVPDLLSSFLFPASKLRMEGLSGNDKMLLSKASNVNPKCDNVQSRVAAYDLLVQLAESCPENSRKIVEELVKVHHFFNENQIKEFEHEPAVERRGDSGFVGLKNAGATCYMNSVLQQLYCTPGLAEQILSVDLTEKNEDSEESVFYQLQNVFGHLLESKLQYYKPERFWHCFRLYGQPVNVREQQDAFEFFTQILDQADEHLAANGKAKTFKRQFEGKFSDQKICQGCPHRYEREEAFMALNLPVKSNNLKESLDQFVKGELLEGDNAYYCEKCQVKRNTVKRMCIKDLPSSLVIQLKRFHYDWETNRSMKFDDYFQFPWSIDMAPYTVKGAEEESNKKDSGPSFRTEIRQGQELYNLVGVVVHSGQASAGHYYSYIKARNENESNTQSGGASGGEKWYKFNDTTVEEFEMTEESLATECFGGSYKVKKEFNSSLPENRQRYWNAYMLFYEYSGSGLGSGRSSASFKRRNLSISQSRLSSGNRRLPSRKVSEPSFAPRESLTQLSDLVFKGEEKGIFRSRMPPTIERVIQEENLRFLENRDVFCEEYYQFIRNFVGVKSNGLILKRNGESSDTMALTSAKLIVCFLFNTHFHLKKRNSDLIRELLDRLTFLCERSRETTEWLMRFLVNDEEGSRLILPFLLECPVKEVRVTFSRIVQMAISTLEKHLPLGTTSNTDVESFIKSLLPILKKDAANNSRTSGQFFSVLSSYAQMGMKQCKQLFDLGIFPLMIKFLLGAEIELDAEGTSDETDDLKKIENIASTSGASSGLLGQRRRWTSMQIREFGELHTAISHLVLSCNLSSLREENDEAMLLDNVASPERKVAFTISSDPSDRLIPVPASVKTVLGGGDVSTLFVRECLCACREAYTDTPSVAPIVEMLVQATYKSPKFSKALLQELLRQYNTVNSGELKNISTLLLEVMVLQDSLQPSRIKFLIDGESNEATGEEKASASPGSSSTSQTKIDGLLALIQTSSSQSSAESVRAYQCIKTLVHASNKSQQVKEYLLSASSRWEWAVNWLKTKMADHGSVSSTTWTSGGSNSDANVVSNEDPNIRTFHRTTSAQVTLDEANAILAEFGVGSNNSGSEAMDTDADVSTSSIGDGHGQDLTTRKVNEEEEDQEMS